ncbi:MAG: hypothetical protein ACKOAV_00900, partial [Bacteroidota bacterium]
MEFSWSAGPGLNRALGKDRKDKYFWANKYGLSLNSLCTLKQDKLQIIMRLNKKSYKLALIGLILWLNQ